MASTTHQIPKATYATSRVAIQVDELGSGMSAWVTADGVPPLFIEADEGRFADVASAVAWAKEHRGDLDALILAHGGIVLRGFPLKDASDFNELVHVFPTYKPGYVGGMSPRKKVKDDVLESTRLDKNFKIQLHSEMSYMKKYPPRIAFFCRQAASVGGETIIGKMSEFMKRLPAELDNKIAQHGYHVVRNFAPAGNTKDAAEVSHPDQIGWDEAFYAETREEVEERCRELGMTPTWNADGSLTLVEISDPFTIHPKTGERFYRANLHVNNAFDDGGLGEVQAEVRKAQARPTGHYLGNGEMLTRAESDKIVSILGEIELAWQWQDGDVMILDNLQVLHGRNPFDGPREIMVALLDE